MRGQGSEQVGIVVGVLGSDGDTDSSNGDTMKGHRDMRRRLQAIVVKLELLIGLAAELEASEREKTAERYEGVTDMIEAAIAALGEAVDQLGG